MFQVIDQRLANVAGFNTQSFIVRIWIETREIEGEPMIWRGFAQQVATGDQIYFKDFSELIAFLASKSSIPYSLDSGLDAKERDS